MPVVNAEEIRADAESREHECCRVLEEGRILFFARSPFALPQAERAFLLKQRQAEAGYHKNIAYRPESGKVTGVARQQREDERELRRVLRAYSDRVVRFAAELFPGYARRWRVDFASFRPQEEAGRRLSTHARNDLLHVDSFPTRPTRGDRIFRVFTNVNPSAPRVWRTGETFEDLAERFAVSSGLLERATRDGLGRRLRHLARLAGLPLRVRPPYDEFMLGFHHFLKENGAYQESARSEEIAFPPGSSWMVFTDMVSHSVLAGQYALEQTFLISRDSLTIPGKAPVSILERIAGRALA